MKPPPQLLLGLDVTPPGLRYLPDFVTHDEATALLTNLQTLPLRNVVVHGQVAKRTVARLGAGHGREADAAPTAIPAWLTPLVARVAPLVSQRPEAIDSIMVIRYPPGARLGWNKDRGYFGPILAELTLGAGVALRLRQERAHADGSRATYALDAAPGSLFVLGGAARSEWQYMLQPRDGDDDRERWAVTFRTLTRR